MSHTRSTTVALCRRRGRHGFTLIELVAVIVVVAILAASAIPTLNSLGSSRAATAGRQVLRDLTFAQQRAVATGVRSWVTFNVGTGTWTVLAEDPNSPGRAGATALTDPLTGQPYATTAGVDDYAGLTLVSASFDGNPEVGFDWLGRPLNHGETALAANGSVTVTGGHVVTVARGTGHVSYVPPP